MVDSIIEGEGEGEGEALNKYKASVAAGCGSGDDGMAIKEQDRLLPIANVGRIMKQILPANAKISKEAKETMQECASEFISFVTGEASDKCHKEKRKTVNGDDICWALGSLGFDEYAEPLKRYLNRFRELEGERANQNKSGNSEEKVMNQNLAEPRKITTHVSPTSINFNVMDESSNSLSRSCF
ncbi:nuclear transcription factor Y subunit B-5-like [Coffea eugenioides]|uniref:nuclear transcription factor Y subunit B-5-like n=1 Tax=Coffea eugenioides TaxID=49369 RepID=UPI000F612645|nr:nuclear transcription factor Y subunit B-5-like [Coffea eugenioides]